MAWQKRNPVLGLLMVGAVVLYFVGSKSTQEPLPAEPNSVPGVSVATTPEAVAVPHAETELASIVDKYARLFDSAPNDMAKGALRPQRASEICRLPLREVIGWIGRVSKLSANNDGNGVLEVQLSEKLSVGTWNNSLSDMGDHTLIPAGSRLHRSAVALQKGQLVTLSGRFLPDNSDCLRETSLSVTGAMKEPRFLFRFEEIHPFAGSAQDCTINSAENIRQFALVLTAAHAKYPPKAAAEAQGAVVSLCQGGKSEREAFDQVISVLRGPADNKR